MEVLAGPDSTECEEELPVEILEETVQIVPDSNVHFKRIETPEMSLEEEETAEITEFLKTDTPDDLKEKEDEDTEKEDTYEFESQDILSGLKMTEELANICHIDSSETSDDSPEGRSLMKYLNSCFLFLHARYY